VAVHTTVVVPTAYGPAGIGPDTLAVQLSVDVAVPIDALDVHEPASVVTFAVDGQLITGNSLSLTVTVNVQAAGDPHEPVAVAETVVVPIGNNVPGFCEYVITGDVPVAVAAKLTIAPHDPASLLTVISPGQVIVVFGFTVTLIT